MISIVIPVQQYSDKLMNCLVHLEKNTEQNFEVIIVGNKIEKIRSLLKGSHLRIRLLNCPKTNLSNVYNIGASYSRGKILAFLSDDCYPERNWAKEIYQSFQDPSQICVTGNTYPFRKSKPTTSGQVYCTFTNPKKYIIRNPKYHAKDIGFSNNFAVLRSYFLKLGGFREIFAPGQFGIHANDADFFLRVLIDKKPIFHNPKMIVFHDHWISGPARFSKSWEYLGGEVVCYGLYALKGYSFGKAVIYRDLVSHPLLELKKIMMDLLNGSRHSALNRMNIFLAESGVRIQAVIRSGLLYIAGY